MQRLHANFALPVNGKTKWNTTGTAAVESYGTPSAAVDFAVMCPGSKDWRELLIQRLEYIAKAYQADSIFLDQVCGCWAYPCYSRDHNHARPNESWSGYLLMLKEIRRRLRDINADFLLATEGVCDILGQYFDVQQGHNDWDTQVGTKSLPMPELYSYTFPKHVVNTGFVSPNNYYYLKLAHAVGSGLDLCAIEPNRLEKRFLRYIEIIMQWRKEYSDVLRGGEYLGTLPCDSSHYLAHAFEKGDSVIATCAWVPYKSDPQKPERIRIILERTKIRTVRLFTDDGEQSINIETNGNESIIDIPFNEIGLLEIKLSKLASDQETK